MYMVWMNAMVMSFNWFLFDLILNVSNIISQNIKQIPISATIFLNIFICVSLKIDKSSQFRKLHSQFSIEDSLEYQKSLNMISKVFEI